MKEEIAAKIPYVRPLLGFPKTVPAMGTPRIMVEIHVKVSLAEASGIRATGGTKGHSEGKNESNDPNNEKGSNKFPKKGIIIEINAHAQTLDNMKREGYVKDKFRCLEEETFLNRELESIPLPHQCQL